MIFYLQIIAAEKCREKLHAIIICTELTAFIQKSELHQLTSYIYNSALNTPYWVQFLELRGLEKEE